MSSLHNQVLVYTATSNTAIRKSTATPIRAKPSNRNVERPHKEKTSHFSFFQNRFLKCSYSTLSWLKSLFTIAFIYTWHPIIQELSLFSWPKTCVIYLTKSKDNIPLLPRSTENCPAQLSIPKAYQILNQRDGHTYKLLKT